MTLVDIVSGICLVGGCAFGIIGAVGLLRFPDFYSRLHAAGITDTLSAALILVGLMIQAPSFTTAAKLLLVLVFLFFTSPTATHALARVALLGGFRPPVTDPDRQP